ncbi:MAG: trypsin-like peptidase domain-containing protein [Candidatus Methanomethylophilaceae archaeon]|nr:trypsin-like peptidase domain-containing protein [Candidatus Methanomethylophilaceae archaeon]
MTIIPKQFIDSVVSIGIRKGESSEWIGTGFIVGYKEKDGPDGNSYSLYLITNKHVASAAPHVIVRFNLKNGKVKDYDLDFTINNSNNYTPHDKGDVIACLINPKVLETDQSEIGIISLAENTLTVNEMELNGISEGSIVYTLGFPLGLVENNRKAPICRMGCLSRTFNKNDDEPYYLIDAQVFPGNSGGPVIYRPDIMSIKGTKSYSKSALIGILYAYLPYQTKLMDVQTKQIVSIISENSGLTKVCPVDYIKEVVEIERDRINTKPLNRRGHPNEFHRREP